MTITIKKTIREDIAGRFPDSSSRTGYSRYTYADLGRGRRNEQIATPARAPKVVPYDPEETPEERGFRGGTIHTSITVDQPLQLNLTEREAEIVLAALLSSRQFTKGMYGHEPSMEQRETALHIERVFAKAGVPDDFILQTR